MKRLKRPNSLFLKGEVSSAVLKTWKNSSACQSDNIYASKAAHGSSESLCPKFFKTPMKVVDTLKILGAVPLRSQVIQICVPQKRLF